MNQLLRYRIAEHDIVLKTPDAETTANILKNFSPFQVADTEKFGTELFTFSGNKAIEKPNSAPVDKIEWYGINSTIYAVPNGTVILVEINGVEHWFRASADWTEIDVDFSPADPNKKLFLNQFIMMAFGISSAFHDTIKIHASVIQKEQKALLFLGKSGTGKSTHSRLWQEFVPGCSLLNDDEPIVRMLKDGSVRVYGSPWSGKTPCYKNESAEVAAFVHLYQSPENKLTRLNTLDSFKSIYISTSILRSDSMNKNCVLDTVSAVLQRVPVYRLDCRPDYEAVSLTRTLLP